MVSWTTFSFDLSSECNLEDEYYIQLQLHLREEHEMDTTWWNGTVYARHFGHVDENDRIALLRETSKWWDYACVIDANNTADMGDAAMYENTDAGAEQIDSYREDEHGFVGSRAAAYMTMNHHFTVQDHIRHEDINPLDNATFDDRVKEQRVLLASDVEQGNP